MKILVISDTHISTVKNELSTEILKEIESADMCIHAGDFIEYKVFEELSELTKTYGVCGNMDDSETCKKLPDTQIINIEGVNIALTHGRGSPLKLIPLIKDIFKDDYNIIDIFVFGHSHLPLNKIIDNKIYFNPGSPTDKVFTPYNSYGILKIRNGIVKRRLVKIG